VRQSSNTIYQNSPPFSACKDWLAEIPFSSDLHSSELQCNPISKCQHILTLCTSENCHLGCVYKMSVSNTPKEEATKHTIFTNHIVDTPHIRVSVLVCVPAWYTRWSIWQVMKKQLKNLQVQVITPKP
jgi:hypothetical protein